MKTGIELLYEAFPLHAQRILELTTKIDGKYIWKNEHFLNAKDILLCSFAWCNTEEGHDYWRNLANGVK